MQTQTEALFLARSASWISEVVHFRGSGFQFVAHSHIDAERGRNTEFVFHIPGVFPVAEAAIKIPDRDRKQIGSAQQEILYRGAPEIREKAQRSAARIALQVVHLRAGCAPAELERMPPHGPAKAGEGFETILHPQSGELYSGTDRSQFRLRGRAAGKNDIGNR